MTQHVAIVVGLALILSGCSSSSPTAPTAPPVVNTPPVSVTPTPANPLLADPQFDREFYRKFVLGVTGPNLVGMSPLRRQAVAPHIYLRSVNDIGVAVPFETLDATAAALINTTGMLTGVFGLAGMEIGTATRRGVSGWITVEWNSAANQAVCGEAPIGGDSITLYPNTPGCGCGSLAIRPKVVKHELGHALGFRHTDNPNDLMYGGGILSCDMNPSEQEIFHARVAYSMPIGSLDP